MLLRLFFAIPIPEKVKAELLGLFPAKKFPGMRFTPEENLHITAHFLGAVEEEKIPEVIQKAKKVSEHTSTFSLMLDSFKTIWEGKKPVMIWAQFHDNLSYENLCFRLRESFPTDENRKPTPHITLARIRQLKQVPFELPSAKKISVLVEQVELWQSFTKAEGAEYKCLHTWKLK